MYYLSRSTAMHIVSLESHVFRDVRSIYILSYYMFQGVSQPRNRLYYSFHVECHDSGSFQSKWVNSIFNWYERREFGLVFCRDSVLRPCELRIEIIILRFIGDHSCLVRRNKIDGVGFCCDRFVSLFYIVSKKGTHIQRRVRAQEQPNCD